MMKQIAMFSALLMALTVYVYAQAPLYSEGNLLVVGVWNTDLGSSDEIAVVQIEANGTILVDEGHAVKYIQNGNAANIAGVSDWMNVNFNDSGWSDGQNGVGYSSSQITAVPDTDDEGAIYSRFAPFAGVNASEITIRADYDDGCIVWLNEVEILRVNMGTDTAVPAWDFGAVSHESTNLPGPNAARWNATVSNLLGVADDNADGTIVVTTAPVRFMDTSTSVEPAGKLTTAWATLKSL